MTDDKHLLFLIKNGDREAFDKLFRRWYPSLVAYAGQFINREDAEDVVQDIMFNLWKNALTLTIRSDVNAYLYSAVKNRCLNYIDKAAVRDRYHSSVRQSVMDSAEDVSGMSVSEISSMLSDALGALPEEQRTAFVKSRANGLKYEEIARDGGVSVKTVEYRISKVLKKLRLALADYLHA